MSHRHQRVGDSSFTTSEQYLQAHGDLKLTRAQQQELNRRGRGPADQVFVIGLENEHVLAFDVTKAMFLIGNRAPNAEVEVNWLYEQEFGRGHDLTYVDPTFALADQVNLSAPLILATLGTLGTLLIDGHHRLFKAQALGVAKLPSHELSPEETDQVLVAHADALPGWQRKFALRTTR